MNLSFRFFHILTLLFASFLVLLQKAPLQFVAPISFQAADMLLHLLQMNKH